MATQRVDPKAAEALEAVKAVGQDADACYEAMKAEDSQLTRRNWIRAYFAWVESMCFALRRFVIEKKFQKRIIRPIDIPEFAALSEIRYSVTAKGDAVAEPANTRTLDYIGFSLMACSRLFKLGLTMQRGDKNWENLVQALGVRDRITHPKTLKAVTVTDADVEAIEQFRGWFSGHLEILFNEKIKTKLRKEMGIAKRTQKARTLVFDESHFMK